MRSEKAKKSVRVPNVNAFAAMRKFPQKVIIEDENIRYDDALMYKFSNKYIEELESRVSRYRTVDGILYSADMKTLILCPAGKTGEITIPDGVERIRKQAFFGSKINKVIFPDSLVRLQKEAFYGCENLKEIDFGNGIEQIGGDGSQDIFSGCAFEKLVFPPQVKEIGINVTGLRKDDKVHTTLALVHTYPDGDRDFSFYRDPGADMMLTEEEIPEELILETRIFHFGTLSMTHEKVRRATKKAVAIAKQAGAIISFDPNIREPLWNSMDEAREQVLYGLGQCHILKISDNEIQWLTGKNDYTEAVKWIREKYDIPLILVSMGKEGSRAYYQDRMVEKAPFINENTIETTGAGDTFCACVLHYICKHGLENLTEKNLKEMLTYANAAASIITTRKGALRVMPRPEEIEALIAGHH